MLNMKYKYDVKHMIWGKRRLNKPKPAPIQEQNEDQEPDFEQMRRDAMKSLFVLPEVEKTDEGHRVV